MRPMLRLLVGSTLDFDPIFLYITLAICGVLVLCRVLLGWAMRE
jgi:hypothetical protein